MHFFVVAVCLGLGVTNKSRWRSWRSLTIAKYVFSVVATTRSKRHTGNPEGGSEDLAATRNRERGSYIMIQSTCRLILVSFDII